MGAGLRSKSSRNVGRLKRPRQRGAETNEKRSSCPLGLEVGRARSSALGTPWSTGGRRGAGGRTPTIVAAGNQPIPRLT